MAKEYTSHVVGSTQTSYKVKRFIFWIILLAIAFAMIYPFLWMISTSLKTTEEYYQPGINLFVQNPRLENYVDALNAFPFFTYLKNTLITTIFPMLFACVSASLIAFGFSKYHAPGSNVLFMCVLATMMLPEHVKMIPSFILFRELDWINSLYPLIVPSLFGSAFNIFLMRQFYMKMPANLDEAAKIDGCNAFQIWYKIYVPLSKPVLGSIAIFEFMGKWNDFMNPLIYINSDRYKTLALGLNSFVTQYVTNTPFLMAASIVIILPCLTLFFLFQNTFISGISFSGVDK